MVVQCNPLITMLIKSKNVNVITDYRYTWTDLTIFIRIINAASVLQRKDHGSILTASACASTFTFKIRVDWEWGGICGTSNYGKYNNADDVITLTN